MKTVKKVDARRKLEGKAKFLDDYSYDGMIYGQFFCSNSHHGIIKKIIFPQEYDLSQFIIVSAKDIPGKNIVPEPECDQPFIAEKEVFHFGQIILGVAHPCKETLKDFIKNIKIEYKELPALADTKETLKDEMNSFGRKIIIDYSKNVKPKREWIHTHSVYYTPHQEQAYLEPQGMIAIHNQEQKTMFVKGTMQCPFFVKDAVEAIMGDKIKEAIIETSEGIGGAFGGKEDFPNIIAGIASLLSYKSKKPVKIVLDRSDDMKITTKRHPSRVEIDTYTDSKTHKIKKINIDYRLDAGAYQTLSPVVLSRGVLHSGGGYACEDVYIKGQLYKSNTPSNGAFRGFGAPQAFFAIESHIDKIAASLNLDPYEFRRMNIFRIGDEFPSTQKITENHLFDCFEKIIEKSDYHRKIKEFAKFNKSNDDKKGIGIAIAYHGGGYTGNGEKVLNSEVKIVIEKNGVVKVFVSNADMGQGAHTTLAQLVNETLSYPFEKTIVQIPNTSKTPNSGPTVASRTIYIVGNLLRKLALKIKKELQFENLEEFISNNQEYFPKEFRMHFVQDPSVIFDEETYKGIAYKDYSWVACIAEIYYHSETYTIEPKRIWAVFDIGNVVNVKIAEGQAEGGIMQGVGYGLTEFFYKKGYGRMQGLTDYALPTSLDIPEINVEFIHTNSDFPKGLGEVPMNAPAPALRNAFYNATKIFIDEIPLTPERILKHIEKKK